MVDAVGYGWFFVYAATLGIPAVILIALLMRTERLH
jgi:hypothetical protein